MRSRISIYSKIRSRFEISSIEFRSFRCPICGRSILFKTFPDETAVRCVRCFGTPVHFSIVDVVRKLVSEEKTKTLYELSSRGASLRYYRKHFKTVLTSELYDDTPLGNYKHSIRCEDIQNLTFESNAVDACTATEVMEHVPDDMKAFREVFRILKPAGLYIFTVPLSNSLTTVERVQIREGKRVYLEPPAYHGDRIQGDSQVLVYRDYGLDILERLRSAGFTAADIHLPQQTYFGYSRPVIVGTK